MVVDLVAAALEQVHERTAGRYARAGLRRGPYSQRMRPTEHAGTTT